MSTGKLLLSLTMPAAVAVCLAAGACSTASGVDDETSATTSRGVTSTVPTTSSTPAAPASDISDISDIPDISAIDTVAGTAGSDFYCGEFGSEHAPTLIAIDLTTGVPTWTVCSESAIPLLLVGRADGATIMLEQNGRGGAELVAVDDLGQERWRRPTRVMGAPSLHTAGPTAVVVTDVVEGIDAATGNVRWQHQVADGTPVGATDDLVVEISGGPYALSTDVDRPVPATMRAIDPATGEQRWSRVIDVVDVPVPGQFAPTVGDEVIVVPRLDGRSTIIDIEDGSELRIEDGPVEADGALLIARDAMFRPTDLIEPHSGERVALPAGLPVYAAAFRGQLPEVPGLLLTSDPPSGPAATLQLVDTSTGDVRWEVPHSPVIGGSDDLVFVVDGPLLRVLDGADGSVVVEFEAPTDLATFSSAVGADGVVIATTQWRGSPAGSGTGGYVPPDCSGGPSIFDGEVGSTRLQILESADGAFFCGGAGPSATVGYAPTMPTPDPRHDSMSMGPTYVLHTIALPAGFGDAAAVMDAQGAPIQMARGVGSDYLILVEPFSGGPDSMPPMVERTVDLLDEEGAVIARFSYSGFSTQPAGETATFEDFFACASEHGIALPPPIPAGGGPAFVDEPSSPDVLDAAWAACRDVFAMAIQSSPPVGASVDDVVAQTDCMVEAGVYDVFSQPVVDEAARLTALEHCRSSTTGSTGG